MIRKSTTDDKELIQQLMQLCFGDKNNLEPYEDLENRYYLYFKNENLVAMSGLTSNSEYGHLEIDWTCTRPEHRHNLIWENDIVKGKYYDGGKAYEHMGQIEYDCQSYKVVGINQYKGYHAELDSLYETVGNIFDNPEFIEEREDIELD